MSFFFLCLHLFLSLFLSPSLLHNSIDGLFAFGCWRGLPSNSSLPSPLALASKTTHNILSFLHIFYYFLAASAAKNCEKKAVIQSAASAASARGGCTSSRLVHGLKFWLIWGGCASSRLISRFSGCDRV